MSALTSWVAFCIFLSPFLSGELFWDSYRSWEGKWKVQLEQSAAKTAEELDEISAEAAAEIVEEIGEDYEVESDR